MLIQAWQYRMNDFGAMHGDFRTFQHELYVQHRLMPRLISKPTYLPLSS
jgi:hypothetical protein